MTSSYAALLLLLAPLCAQCSILPFSLPGLRRFGPAEPQHLQQEALSSKPWFCHDLECPSFDVLNKSDVYETRRYNEATFATTSVDAVLYTPAVTTGFKRLFDYIGGANENDDHIPMTAPVMTAVTPGQGPFCVSHYNVSFFMPEKYQENPPKPVSEQITFRTYPASVLYVKSFGGFIVDGGIITVQLKALQAALEADNLKFQEAYYFISSYDPPTRVTGRHNEVAVEALIGPMS